MPPRWGLGSVGMVGGYKHAAPPALDPVQAPERTLQTEAETLKRLPGNRSGLGILPVLHLARLCSLSPRPGLRPDP
jgi:hypothetical protein